MKIAFQEKAFDSDKLTLPHWMNDSRRFSYVDATPEGDGMTLWMYDITSGERKAVIPTRALTLPKGIPLPDEGDSDDEIPGNAKSGLLRIRGYQWSPDETQVLFAREPEPHAAVPGDTSLFIYSLATGKMQCVTTHKLPHRNVKWSPDRKRIGYVRGEDIYVLDVSTRIEMRLTNSAAPTIFNGRFGWVYEEELDLLDGWEWSPDGKR
ncbi:MAG TPA: DPP IV N-terminal domain-containing protein, partial [Chthonomonadaceae bacterium]|nr:DPP IV N-terminal domain-containing protein [Chthonomonadaceae bacterium]